MTRTGIFVALTLACCAAELRAQMAYPYISPPGLGSRGGRMARRSVSYAPTYYATPTYYGSVVTSPTVIDGSTVITQPSSPIILGSSTIGTTTSPVIIGGRIVGGTIISPTTSPTIIGGTTTTPTLIGGTIVGPTPTPTVTPSGTIISSPSYTPVSYTPTTSRGFFGRVRGGRTTAPVAGTYGSPGVIYIR